MTKTEANRLLKESGLWQQFSEARRDLVQGGMSRREASDEALKEFKGRLAEFKKTRVTPPAASAVPHEGAPERQELATSEDRGPPARGRKPEDLTDPAEVAAFQAKESPIIDQIKWVAKYLYRDLSPLSIEEIPCAEAWNMLLRYRASEEAKRDFMDKAYMKLVPTRANMNNDNPEEYDGADIVKDIRRVQKAREKAIRHAARLAKP